jgi:hypothetical protein
MGEGDKFLIDKPMNTTVLLERSGKNTLLLLYGSYFALGDSYAPIGPRCETRGKTSRFYHRS